MVVSTTETMMNLFSNRFRKSLHLEPRIYFVFASQMRKEMDSDLLKFVFSNSAKETNTFYFKRGGKIFFEAKRVQSEMFEV